MTSRERVLATFNRQEIDRVPRWCGASPAFLEKAKTFLNVTTDEEVFLRFGDDFRRVYSRFVGSENKTGSNSVFGVTHHGIGCGQANVHPLQDATLRDLFDLFFTPHLKRLAALGHSYGLTVMLHCCGSFVPLMPSLIEAGIDGLQGLQPTTKDMDVVNLMEKFGDKLIFNGCVDSIRYLIDGTPETVTAETRRVLDATRSGGFILSASHDYLLEETPVENVLAMYDCV